MNEQQLMKFFGFGDDHVPLVKVAKSQKRQEIPVSFPTRKAAQKSIRARSTLMRDALIHFETNPDVVRISAYPIKLEYEITNWHGVIASVSHIPMIGVWSKQKQASFFDVIPLSIQEERGWIASRTATLKRVFWEEYRATYAVLDERELHIQPRMVNLATIRYHAYRHDVEAVTEVRRALTMLPETTTIQTITDAAALSERAHVFYEEDGSVAQRRVLHEVKRAFSAVMWLAVQGEVKVDISTPIALSSTVTKTMGVSGSQGRAA
ncbi:hypothetical protein WMC41_13545 [Shinella yambaruensis]|uniref:hypothetical protein n=1 Tax=Shinella yambaruensis TaxID=415996 RepID=UPI003D7AAD0B